MVVMARKLRIQYPGAVYHVMSRGNQGGAIFQGDSDRKVFLDTLAEGCEKTGWRLHAYVLMANHYHLLVETPEGNLVVGMKWLQGTYTQRYNARHEVFGHLFQGRYKALIVDGSADEYFQVVSTYIHLNPARAGLIRIGEQSLSVYRWSSYPSYLRRTAARPPWLRVDRVLGSVGLGVDDARGRQGYEAYIEGRVLELQRKQSRGALNEEWRRVRRGWYLGSGGFRHRLEKWLEKAMAGKARPSISGEARQAHDEAAAAGMLARGLAVIGLGEGDLAGLAKGAKEKQVLAWWLRKRTAVSRGWVSRRLQMGDESRVTQAVAAVERTRDRDVVTWRAQLERQASCS
jgi:REP element-mobilizing transposase RayT